MSGIIELPADAPVGAPCRRGAGLDDPVIDVKVTPNRPDCMGVHGIARDLAAAGLGTLKPVQGRRSPARYPQPDQVAARLEATPDRPARSFVGRHVRGVSNGPSPDWLQRRLKAIGQRPISALVDITNYRDLRPRPAAARLRRRRSSRATSSCARRATGEKVAGARRQELRARPSMTVIADAKGVHGIGGIMGGEDTGVSEATTDVFLEVAYFDADRASPPPAASSASSPTRATASSAASIPHRAGGAPKWRPA